ncbi:MAG TPA: hypothetical protein VFG21_06135 [Xanthomonadaceae bacterium]|nr:hypothetical protein [Xanthomonadaceae bacterium]
MDARIRAAARAAVAGTRPSRLRPWPWGLSTAAAAVLALAFLWQSGLPPQREATDEFGQPVEIQLPEATLGIEPDVVTGAATSSQDAPQAAARETEAVQDDASAELDRVEVGGSRVRAQEEFVPEPPADAARQIVPATPSTAPKREPVPAESGTVATVPPPPPPPPVVLDEARESVRDEAAAGAGAERRDYGVAQPLPQAPPPQSVPAPAFKGRALPPVAADEHLDPEAWLQRIRERLRAGDREGATHSLQRFQSLHPHWPVPDDLQMLLR